MTPRPVQRRYVAYYRVSTTRQGRSGLGLAAQERAVEEFLGSTGGSLVSAFTEVQSGKDDFRPKLSEALRSCRVLRATLLIAKLDRLSRNAAFLLTLQQAGTRFVACDAPDMNEAVVGIMAVLAQAERKAISERTRAALAAAKRRGVKLGNPKLKAGTKATARTATEAARKAAKARAEELRETVDSARNAGAASLRALAEHLNALGVLTPRGGQWAAASIARLLDQLAA